MSRKTTASGTMEEVVEVSDTMEESVEKPYTFRKFSSPDIFPMFKIVSLIGVNEFTSCFENDVIVNTMQSLFGEKKEVDEDKAGTIVGISVTLEVANVIFANLPKCESYIYQLLSQTSNLTVEEIKGLSMATFAEMIIDFIKKDDFKDFIQVVSKQFK